MSNLSNALRIAVETSGRSQQDLADSIGMAQSQFSRYCNGRGDVSPPVLTKIVELFAAPISSDLLRAYLIDQCPARLQHLVDIQLRGTRVDEPITDGLAHLPEPTREALRLIGSRCNERPVLNLVLDLAKLLRTDFGRPIPTKKIAALPADQSARKPPSNRE